MRDLPDRQLEPEDPMPGLLADEAKDQAEEDAWSDYLLDGDPVELIEEYATEDAGEVFDLIRAYRDNNQADLTSTAYKMAVKLEAIAEGYLDV